MAVNPHNTVFDTKRLIGRKYTDDSVRSDVKLWPFKVEAGANNKPMIRVQFKFESKVRPHRGFSLSAHPYKMPKSVLVAGEPQGVYAMCVCVINAKIPLFQPFSAMSPSFVWLAFSTWRYSALKRSPPWSLSR